LTVLLKNKLLVNDHQYGFQANRSTEMAAIELVEKITSAIEDKK